MKRSHFIKGVAGFLGVSLLPQYITVKQYQRIYLLQSFVRGFGYYEGPELLQKMRKGDMLELVREPKNEYDDCAIALHFDEKKIGFLPQEDNEILSKLLDAKVVPLQAEITHLKTEAKTWENVHIAVYILKELDEPLPKQAAYLTVLDTPRYRSLKINKDRVANVYYDEALRDEDVVDVDAFYEKMVANSKDDGIYDILHNDFGSSENLEQAISEGRMIVNRKALPIDLQADELINAIDEHIIALDDCFGEQGYVVANINRVAKMSGRIEKVATVADHLGRRFYEIKFV